MRTIKDKPQLSFEAVLGQLRHAYALLVSDAPDQWALAQRKSFATGLLGPQIEKLEQLQRDFDDRGDDLLTALAANARHRTKWTEAERVLLSRAHDIASASEARRIILSVFHEGS